MVKVAIRRHSNTSVAFVPHHNVNLSITLHCENCGALFWYGAPSYSATRPKATFFVGHICDMRRHSSPCRSGLFAFIALLIFLCEGLPSHASFPRQLAPPAYGQARTLRCEQFCRYCASSHFVHNRCPFINCCVRVVHHHPVSHGFAKEKQR